MAISVTLSTGVTGDQVSAATQVVTVVGADILPGDVIVVAIAADNAGTSGVSSISTPTDSQGHIYSLIKNQNRTAGSAANDACTAALYVVRCTKAMANGVDTITANFSPNTTAKVTRYKVFRGVEDISYSTGGVGGTGTTYNSGLTATASATTGDLVIGVIASESNTLITADTDTTNGSWVAAASNSGGGGADTTKMGVSIHHKIVTGTGTQTLNGTCANSDWAVAWGLFTVPVTKSDAETGAAVDTESVNTGSQPSDAETGTAVDAGESILDIETKTDPETASGADGNESLAVAISDVSVVVLAAGGLSGTTSSGGGGASVSLGIGQTKFDGADGAGGEVSAGDAGGGGGASSAGTASAGSSGALGAAGVGGAGGTAPSGGGDGGHGGSVATGGSDETAGVTPGGGGGGGFSSASVGQSGGFGGGGVCKFTYNDGATTVRTYTGTSAGAVSGSETSVVGATQVVIECWGSGGGGGDGTGGVGSGGGGGGGAYSKSTVALTSQVTFQYFAAKGPFNFTDGGASLVTAGPGETGTAVDAAAIAVTLADTDTKRVVNTTSLGVSSGNSAIADFTVNVPPASVGSRLVLVFAAGEMSAPTWRAPTLNGVTPTRTITTITNVRLHIWDNTALAGAEGPLTVSNVGTSAGTTGDVACFAAAFYSAATAASLSIGSNTSSPTATRISTSYGSTNFGLILALGYDPENNALSKSANSSAWVEQLNTSTGNTAFCSMLAFQGAALNPVIGVDRASGTVAMVVYNLISVQTIGGPATAADAGEAVADTLTDDEPASAVDAGESISSVLTDADNGIAVDAGEFLAAILSDFDSGVAAEFGVVDITILSSLYPRTIMLSMF